MSLRRRPIRPRNAGSQIDRRRAKLERCRLTLTHPLQYRFDADHSAADLAGSCGDLAAGARTEERVSVAGRLILVRRHGGLTFGVRARPHRHHPDLRRPRAPWGSRPTSRFRALDRGDWIGVTGTVMRTDKGELSVALEDFETLGKALRPPPDKDKGLVDVEVRYRQRYVDLMTNERTRRIFEIRRRVIRAIRGHLDDRGFWEVEGPMLGSIQGGATARPFISHHNALDIDMYLRIALELHLKRLVVGGMERVFEIGRVFRNEGIDVRHNPEFTMLEAYQAFADYVDMMDLVEGMVVAAIRDALDGNFVVKVGDHTVDLTPPWPRITMSDLIEQKLGVRMDPTMPVEEARAILDGLHIEWENGWGSGKLMKQVVDEKIQHDIVDPIFCIDYPQEVSPLARVHRSRPGYVERFELMVAGFELCNAYSEQNDAKQQLAAFELEARAKAEGDPEAGDIDLRLRARARIRHAVHRRSRHRDRPAGDAAVRGRQHPRGHPLPDDAAGRRAPRPERAAAADRASAAGSAGCIHRRAVTAAAAAAPGCRRARRARRGARRAAGSAAVTIEERQQRTPAQQAHGARPGRSRRVRRRAACC